jgi:hypothetical protein
VTETQDDVRERLQQKRALFSLRELEERTGVSNVVLHNFLSGKSLHPVNLRKILAWLDGGLPPVVEEMDRLLAELYPGVDLKVLEPIRVLVWRAISRGFRHVGRDVPGWVSSQVHPEPAGPDFKEPQQSGKQQRGAQNRPKS